MATRALTSLPIVAHFWRQSWSGELLCTKTATNFRAANSLKWNRTKVRGHIGWYMMNCEGCLKNSAPTNLDLVPCRYDEWNARFNPWRPITPCTFANSASHAHYGGADWSQFDWQRAATRFIVWSKNFIIIIFIIFFLKKKLYVYFLVVDVVASFRV